MSKQKIIKLSVNILIMLVVSLTIIFNNPITYALTQFLANRCNVISSENNLIVHFIDVGQADATAINLPDGKVVLIDNGEKEVNVKYTQYLRENVVQKDKKIDILILTHADSDHIGGTLKILKDFQVNKVLIPKIMSNSQIFEEIYDQVTKNYSYEILGDEFYIEGENYKFTFFEAIDATNTNDSSQVIKLEYFNKSFLFAADISADVEEEYVLKYGNKLDSDILKISHHGSDTATSQIFLSTVTPEMAIISVGENNQYGHPADEVLARLNENNIKTYRTDKHGNILIVVGKNYNLAIFNGEYFITSLTLKYWVYAICIDVVLAFNVILMLMKKEKSKHRS